MSATTDTGQLQDLLDVVVCEGPVLSCEESERLLNGLANAAREEASRDAIVEAPFSSNRNVFRLNSVILCYFGKYLHFIC